MTIKKIPKDVNFLKMKVMNGIQTRSENYIMQKIGVIHPTQTGSAFNFPIFIESYANKVDWCLFIFDIFSFLMFSLNYLIVKIDNDNFKVLLIVSMSHFFHRK